MVDNSVDSVCISRRIPFDDCAASSNKRAENKSKTKGVIRKREKKQEEMTWKIR